MGQAQTFGGVKPVIRIPSLPMDTLQVNPTGFCTLAMIVFGYSLPELQCYVVFFLITIGIPKPQSLFYIFILVI